MPLVHVVLRGTPTDHHHHSTSLDETTARGQLQEISRTQAHEDVELDWLTFPKKNLIGAEVIPELPQAYVA